MDYARSFAHSDSFTSFIQKPAVILRGVTTFIMMLIFSCVLDKGYSKLIQRCYYNNNQGACNFTVGIAIIAFFVGIAFLLCTYLWDHITNGVTRKYVVFGDMVFSGFWAFLFFIDFCFITDMWRKTAKEALPSMVKSNLQFTIVCALVCIFLLAIQAYLAYKQLNDIQNEASGLAGYNDAAGIAGGYGGGFPPHTESAGGSYQSPYAS